MERCLSPPFAPAAHGAAPFIVGLSQSGTTLLRLMLDAHPQLAIPAGMFFILELQRVCATSANPAAVFLELLTAHWKWPDFHLDAGVLSYALD